MARWMGRTAAIVLSLLAAACTTTTAPPPAPAVTGYAEVSVEGAASATGEARRFFVHLFYPGASRRTPGAYLPAQTAAHLAEEGYYDQPAAALADWTERPGVAVAGADPAGTAARPLLVLLPGQGVSVHNYALLANEFVARGFVVAVADLPNVGVGFAPDGTWRDPSQVALMNESEQDAWGPLFDRWAGDVGAAIPAVLAAAAARGIALDERAIVLAGHSLGGAVAFHACGIDQRIRACADFEGAPFGTRIEREGPPKPSLFVLSRAASRDRPPEAPDMASPMFAFMAANPGVPGWAVAVSGGSHMSFSDAPVVMPDTLTRFGGTIMPAERSMELYADLLAAFARAYLADGGGDAAFARYVETAPELRAAH